jgi:hypothetical protein
LVAEAHSKSPQKPSIDEQAVRRIIEEYERNRPQSASSPSPPPTSTVDEKTVRRIVEDYVDRDRVAMVDYALNQVIVCLETLVFVILKMFFDPIIIVSRPARRY